MFRLSVMIVCKMQSWMSSVLVLVLVFSVVWSSPFPPESRAGLPVVSELSSLVASRTARLQQDPRLPLPTPQDIEAIKKVAQILQMLGEQVIPAIIGGSTPGSAPGSDMPPSPPIEDEPHDAVNNN